MCTTYFRLGLKNKRELLNRCNATINACTIGWETSLHLPLKLGRHLHRAGTVGPARPLLASHGDATQNQRNRKGVSGTCVQNPFESRAVFTHSFGEFRFAHCSPALINDFASVWSSGPRSRNFCTTSSANLCL
ncbi:hypothetical protein MTP99_010449 [Tenebrio molitor]|nr:hypothetical protein MTP99_010449 [Tenebrio molitor]